MKRVLFEVDAGPAIGMGHLSRCKVLAGALATIGLQSVFRIHGSGQPDLAFPFAVADDAVQASAVVVDRYTASADAIATLRARHGTLLVFDDHAERAVAADFILNGNYYAEHLEYRAFAPATLLLGPRYALVTEDFARVSGEARDPREILMTFGLSRISGELPALAAALSAAMPDCRFRVIVPPAYRADHPLPDAVRLIDPAPLARLIPPASLVVCGLGVSWLEVVATGRMVVGVRLVDNQDLMLDALRTDGFPVAAGPEAPAILSAIAVARSASDGVFAPLRGKLDGGGPLRVARRLAERLA